MHNFIFCWDKFLGRKVNFSPYYYQPSARVVFDKEGNVSLKAKRPIMKGESITITYCSALLNTPSRLSKLKSSKFFTCQCHLCCDPTENGTYMSALVCPKCQGMLLPLSFHNVTNSQWKCNKCPFTSINEKVEKLVDTIRNNFNSVSRWVFTIYQVSTTILETAFKSLALKFWIFEDTLIPYQFFEQ